MGLGRVARWGMLLYEMFMAFTEGVWKAYPGELALEGTRAGARCSAGTTA